MADRLLYEMHMHTPLCRHAHGEPEDYALVAEQRGFKGIVVTCHNPMPDGFSQGVRMYPDQWAEYEAMVARARERFAGRVDVRLGLEADWFPGYEDFLEKQISSLDFHHVLGSVHPHTGEYVEAFWDSSHPLDFARTYFRHLAEAAETGLFDTISHPDLVKNSIPRSWSLDALLDDIRRALDRIAATNVAMELNTSGLYKSISEFNPGVTILHEMLHREIPIVVGADAHTPARVGDMYEAAFDTLEAVGYQNIHLTLNRKRMAIPIPAARESLVASNYLGF